MKPYLCIDPGANGGWVLNLGNDAYEPFYELPAESRRLKINGIVTKSAMALLRKHADGATLCHNGENYVVNALDENLASPKKGLKQVTLYAVCYFPA